MLLAIKIGMFYGAPAAAVLLAAAYLAALWRRARRGAITRRAAAARGAWSLALPLAAVVLIWGTAELTGYLAVESAGYAWDGAAALRLLASLLPIAAYTAAPVLLLAAAFWTMLLRSEDERSDDGTAR